MSEDWSHLQRCIDLRRSDVERAVTSRDGCAGLLARLAEVSRPMTGAPLVLLLFARMATNACTWLEAGLYVDAEALGADTAFDVLQDLGVGMRERILPRCIVHAPLSEFSRSVRRIPSMIQPLSVESSDKGLVFTASGATRRSNGPPYIAEVDSSILMMPPTPGMAFVPPNLEELLKKKRL